MDILQNIRDILTSPGRIGPAFWEAAESLWGEGSALTAYNVLFSPERATPEQMRDFSERFLHLSPGWTSFIVDTAVNPATLMGTFFAKGSGILRFGTEPNGAGKAFVREHLPSPGKTAINEFIPDGMKPYSKLLDEAGLPLSARADLVMHERAHRFYKGKLDAYIEMRNAFTDAEWNTSKERIALWADKFRNIPGITPKEIRAAELYKKILDDSWDSYGTIERTASKLGPDGKVVEEIVADVEPIGYHTAYFMHTYNRKMPGLMANSPKDSYDWFTRHEKYVAMQKAGQLDPLPFSPDSTISLSKRYDKLIEWQNTPTGISMLGSFLRKRTQTIPDGLPEYVLDIDKVSDRLFRHGARTFALQTPLTAGQARFLHLKNVDNPVPVENIPVLHSAIRKAYTQFEQTGNPADWAEVERLRGEVSTLYRAVKDTAPMQHSLGFQVTREAAESITGYAPLAMKGAGAFNRVRHWRDKARARVHHEWLSLLVGNRDIEGATIGKLHANMLHRFAPKITPEVVGEINALGAKVGRPNYGEEVHQYFLKGGDELSPAQMESKLAKFTTANLLGGRMASALVQVTQTPAITIPYIGAMNTLEGIAEGVPKLFKAYQHAFREWRIGRQAGVPVTWNRAMNNGFRIHLPEFEASGIPRDFAMLEEAFGRSMDKKGGFNLDTFVDIALSPVAAGEHFNRVVAFYGGRRAYLKRLKANPGTFGYDARAMGFDAASDTVPPAVWEDINRHAAQVVYDTQYVPTPGRMSPWQLKSGPAFRQFTTYPLGFLNSIADLGFKGAIDDRTDQVMQALGKASGGQFRWLPYARYLAVMGGLTNFGRDVMGMDLGNRVMEGAVNLPLSTDTPLWPLPVGPIPGMVVGTFQSLVSGKLDRKTFMDIPGYGTAPIPKAIFPFGNLISQGARILNQVEDGRMLDSKGRGLYEFDTHALVANVLGLKTVESARDDEKIRNLLYTNDRFKEARRQLATALAHGRVDQAEQVKADFAREFKDMPPLSVAQGDILRVHRQMHSDRLERIGQTISPMIRNRIDPAADPAGWFLTDEQYEMNLSSIIDRR